MKGIKHTRLLALLLVFMMAFSLPGPAFAEENSDNIPADTQPFTEETVLSEETVGMTTAETYTQTDSNAETQAQSSEETRDTSGASLRAPQAALVTITDESQLAGLFPDAAFRKAVFRAVEGCEGDTLEEALASFDGDINAGNKGIKDIHGIEYLIRTGSINLTKNQISDFTIINQGDKFYYGDTDGSNLYLDIAGNPIRNIPADFGGRLVIEQPAKSSSTYPEDEELLYYIKEDAAGDISGTLNIGRCKIDGNAWVQLILCHFENNSAYHPGTLEISAYNNAAATFTGLKKSGDQMVAVGVDQELHYWTSDEFDFSTQGSQSFKYYLHPSFWVYTRLRIEPAGTASVTLTKKDSSSSDAGLVDAEFGLYKAQDNSEVKIGLVTDANGKIIVDSLAAGDYYFKETKAPAGYKLNPDKVEFTISIPKLTLGGGLKEMTPTNGQKVMAGDNEIFIAGPDKNTGKSPDITLTADTAADLIKSVKVSYSGIEVGSPAQAQENVVREFTSLDEAQADINTEKNNNTILGPVSVSVEYKTLDVEAQNTKIELISVSGQKVWSDYNDGLNMRPESVQISLYQNDVLFKSTQAQGPDWLFDFTDLSKTDTNGNAYIYIVKEATVPDGYEASVSDTTITNTLKKEYNDIVNVQVEKKWIEADGTASRPKSISVEVYRNDNNSKPLVTLSLSESSGWKGELKSLPKFDANGQQYAYSVKEIKVNDYTCAQTVTKDKDTYKVVITNTKDGKKPETQPNSNNNETSTPKPPAPGVKTGDQTPLLAIGIIALLSAIVIAVSLILRKRNAGNR